MSISTSCVNKPMDCPLTSLPVLTLVLSQPNKTSFSISWVSKPDGCSLFTSLPCLIIGFLILVGFVGSLHYLQQLLNPILSSNYFKKNLLRKSRWRIYFLASDFSRFHHNYFRDSMSRKCVVKDDCVRSCLIELKSFLLSKLYINPIHRVLVSFPLLLVPCKTWCFQVNGIRISVFFVHRIHRRKEYRLSFAQILTSRYQSWIDYGM